MYTYENQTFVKLINDNIKKMPYTAESLNGFGTDFIIAGGSVHDHLNNLIPNDYDFFVFTTNGMYSLIEYFSKFKNVVFKIYPFLIQIDGLSHPIQLINSLNQDYNVVKGFDYDPVKCFYDGTDFFASHKALSEMKSKVIDNVLLPFYIPSIKRYNKMMLKGYTFTENFLNKYLSHMYVSDELQKYEIATTTDYKVAIELYNKYTIRNIIYENTNVFSSFNKYKKYNKVVPTRNSTKNIKETCHFIANNNVLLTSDNVNNNVSSTSDNVNNNVSSTSDNVNNNVASTDVNNNVSSTSDNVNNNVASTDVNNNVSSTDVDNNVSSTDVNNNVSSTDNVSSTSLLANNVSSTSLFANNVSANNVYSTTLSANYVSANNIYSTTLTANNISYNKKNDSLNDPCNYTRNTNSSVNDPCNYTRKNDSLNDPCNYTRNNNSSVNNPCNYIRNNDSSVNDPCNYTRNTNSSVNDPCNYTRNTNSSVNDPCNYTRNNDSSVNDPCNYIRNNDSSVNNPCNYIRNNNSSVNDPCNYTTNNDLNNVAPLN